MIIEASAGAAQFLCSLAPDQPTPELSSTISSGGAEEPGRAKQGHAGRAKLECGGRGRGAEDRVVLVREKREGFASNLELDPCRTKQHPAIDASTK